MALKVKTPSFTAKVSVDTTAGGFQSDSAPKNRPKAVNPQGGSAPKRRPVAYNPQAQNNAAVVKALAEKQREAVRREIARRQQKKIELSVNKTKEKLKTAVETVKAGQQVRVATGYKPRKIIVPKHVISPEEAEYKRVKDEAVKTAMGLIDQTQNANIKGLAGIWDKVSFGSDRRASKARDTAMQQAEATAETQTRIYEQKLDSHNALIAGLQADFEKKKKFMTMPELNKLADSYNKKILLSLKDINHSAAYTEGMLEGFGIKSEKPITSKAANAAGWFTKNVVRPATQNKIWQYTLGEGSKNVPSVVTAPSRLVNFIGNLNTKNRQIYKYGGSTSNRAGGGENAWQSTFNQRNFNIRPTQSKNYYARGANTALEFAADPLNILGGAGAIVKTSKASKYLSKLDDVGRTSKLSSWAFRTADKLSDTRRYFANKIIDSPLLKKLNSEYLSPEEKLSETIKMVKGGQADFIKNTLPRLKQIQAKLSGGTADLSVFDDLFKLSDSESAILQRMTAGKFSVRDRLLLAGRSYEKTRIKLQALSKKWEDFSESMRAADKIADDATRFGRGKRTYSPSTAWTNGDLEKYDFRKFKKRRGVLNTEDMSQGAADRYLKSELLSRNKSGRTRLVAEREELLKRYDDFMKGARSNVAEAERGTVKLGKYLRSKRKGAKYENVSMAKAAGNSVRSFTGLPSRLWKKSVLKYRPAWTVNNVLYNTQAGVLSGGVRYLPEQLKMLNPRYARKAADNIPAELRTKIAKETGAGRLNKFYEGVENNPRIAAFNTLKKQGYSDTDALKRVDKYFFNYTTKQWERPLKTVLPFWSFQKNLTKAAVQMPFDRPIAATAYNRVERYQKADFEKEFAPVEAQLRSYGFSDVEIEEIKKKQAAMFATRLRIGNKHYTLPFNAFSETGLRSFGVNPYLAAAGEAALAEDSNGKKLSGYQASLLRRITTKFPQAELGYKARKSLLVEMGLDEPKEQWIGKKGSSGYGLTKEKQGYAENKQGYNPSIDPRTKSAQDIARFLGKPHEMEFDKEGLLEQKKMEKVSKEYFANSEKWASMDFDKAEKERNAFFKRFGIKPDDFYKGVLAKYDTANAQKIKGLKEEARKKNSKLFTEYGKQPKGTRNMWAAKKLDQLNKAGYFDKNPFLKSFSWLDKEAYQRAGNQRKYKRYTRKESPYKIGDKHFRSAETVAAFKEGQFWKKYAVASREERRLLLEDNPEYNRRADWTPEQWEAWKNEMRKKNIAKVNSHKVAGKSFRYHVSKNRIGAGILRQQRGIKKYQKTVAYG